MAINPVGIVMSLFNRLLARVLPLICYGALSVSAAGAQSNATAPQDPSDPQQLKAEIVKMYCADKGALTRCVGLSGNDCPEVVTPIVERCLEESVSKNPAERGRQIYFCFSSKFNKQYGSRLEKSEECVKPAIIEGALAPYTPELEKQLKPFRQGQ